jgi:hypothetical protein
LRAEKFNLFILLAPIVQAALMKQTMTLVAQLVLIDELMAYHAFEIGGSLPVKVASARDRPLELLAGDLGLRLHQQFEGGEVLLEKEVEIDLNNLHLLVLA